MVKVMVVVVVVVVVVIQVLVTERVTEGTRDDTLPRKLSSDEKITSKIKVGKNTNVPSLASPHLAVLLIICSYDTRGNREEEGGRHREGKGGGREDEKAGRCRWRKEKRKTEDVY